MSNTLTCVYCGHQYPEGTPTSGSKVLTDHIAGCKKHPMKRLRDALVGLVGADGDELPALLAVVKPMADAGDKNAIVARAAIEALIDITAPAPGQEGGGNG